MAPLLEAAAVISFCRASSIVLTPAACQTPKVSGLDAHRAEPGEPLGVVLGAVGADRLHGDQRVREHADGGAVLRRDRIEEVRHLDPAGADHVLRHQHRVARDMRTHMASEQPRLEVVAAADVDADIHVDGLAPVEVGDRVGAGAGRGERDRRHRHGQRDFSRSKP